MKWLRRISIFLIIFAIPICLSAIKAKKAADEILKPISNKIIFNKIWFIPSINFPSSDPPEKYENVWCVSYCPKDEFCCFPLEVYVSLFGELELTNPRDLQQRIKKLK